MGRGNESTFLLGSYTKEKEENAIMFDKGLRAKTVQKSET